MRNGLALIVVIVTVFVSWRDGQLMGTLIKTEELCVCSDVDKLNGNVSGGAAAVTDASL